MKQLSITFLLTVLMSMVGTKTFAHDIAVANDDGVTIYYNFINNGTELTVVFCGSYPESFDEYTGNIVIPESVTYNNQSYSVTSVGKFAFQDCSSLSSITIPNSVTSIGNCAFFRCSSLASITIPNSVTSIGNSAFAGCSNLASITIPNSVTSIGSFAFSGCISLTSITIPNSVTSIGEGAFYECSSLTSITIPNSVTSIGYNAFSGCKSLSSVTLNCSEVGNWFYGNVHIKEVILGDEVTSISDQAFQNCDSLASVTIGNNVSSIGKDAFSGTPWHSSLLNGNGLVYVGKVAYKYNGSMPANTSVTIEDGTLGIAPYAFSGYSDMVSISIPNSVKSIGKNAFYNCSGMTSIDIPDSVTRIGESAFEGCSGLTSIDIPNGVTTIGVYAFSNCRSLTSITIPSSVTTIGTDAFNFCNGLQKVIVSDLAAWLNIYFESSNSNPLSYAKHIYADENTEIINLAIPNGVTNIGNYAFYGCCYLASITIPNSVTSIGNYAFENCGCSSLTSINIPNSVTHIGNYAFYYCNWLTSVNIPSSVTNIGNYAFANCNRLTRVTVGMIQPLTISNGTFPNRSSVILFVPDGCKALYNSATYWQDFKAIFELGTEPITGITLDKTAMTMFVDHNETITASVEPDDAFNAMLKWTSSNTSVATVENGVVTAVGVGTATITAAAKDGTGISATCTVTVQTEADTDISALDNTIYLERAEGFVGSQMRLSVKMKNTVEVQGYQFDLYLPAGVTVAEDGDGFALAELSTARTTAAKTNYFDTAPTSDGGLRVLCGSSKGYTFSGNDGEVAVITLNIAESVAEGEHAIVLRNVKLSDANSTPYSTDYLKSTLAVAAYTPGDANNDGSIDVADFIAVANHILGNTVAGFVVEAADVNEDGSIDVADFIGVANMILHQQVGNSRQMRAEARMMRKAATDLSGLANAIYVEPLTASPGTQQVLSVRMKNATEVAGYEFSLQLPEGVTVATDGDDMLMAELSTERTTATRTNYFDASLQTDGTLKVLCGTSRENPSTGKLYTFSGNDGEVARITVNVALNVAAGDYAVLIKDALISDPDAVKTTLQSVIESTLTVGESTDYDVVLDENDTNVPEASDGAVSVLVRRTINANEWSTICLPFDMTEAQVYDAFGDDVELAEYMEHEMNNEATEITVVFDDALLAEDGLMANYPYIIRTSRNITEFLVEGVTISPDENEAKAEFTNGKTGSRKEVYGTFMGTYHAQTTVPNLCLFLSGNKFWYSTGQTKMKAFRGYFDFEDKLAAVEQANARVALRVKDRTAGLKEVVNSKKETVCFDLQGRRIKSPTKKGLYVVNGKKMVIR